MSNFYTLSDGVQRLESVTVDAQQVLLVAMLSILHRKQRAGCVSGHSAEVSELVDAGLVVSIDDPELAMTTIGHNELVKRLEAAGASGFKKNAKLSALVEWCVEVGVKAGVDVSALTPDVSVFVLAPELERTSRKLCTYLSRKYETEPYFDPETCETRDVPKGMIIESTVGESGVTVHYPDDEITELLDHYGCNRCRTFSF